MENCAIDRDALRELISEDADMSLRIVKWMGLRMQRMERKIDSLTFKDARTGITDFLKDAVAFKGTMVGRMDNQNQAYAPRYRCTYGHFAANGERNPQ